MSNQAVIGIIPKHLSYADPQSHNTSGMIRDEVTNAITAQHAIPLGLTFTKCDNTAKRIEDTDDIHLLQSSQMFKDIVQQIKLCDGLIFQGGKGIDPLERAIAEYAHRKNIPALGFGSGQTVMAKVIAPNLTVIQASDPSHDSPEDYAHIITITPGSQFRKIIGLDVMKVNSRHTHSIVTCPTFKTGARDQDGNIEVIEDPSKRFYLATRFHPESLYNTDVSMREIFSAFIHACIT